jgi:hypothetical protein
MESMVSSSQRTGAKMWKFLSMVAISFSLPLSAGQGPHLILHLDVNRTLIATDPVQNKSLKDVLSAELAERTIQSWSADHPPMSYRQFVDEVLVPGDKFDPVLKAQRRTHLDKFISQPFVDQSLADTYAKLHAKMEGQYIVPSFFKLVRALRAQDISFTLVLRTFGADLEPVTQAIQEKLPEERFETWGKYSQGELHTDGSVLRSPSEVYSFLKASKGHVAIQDDWKTWHNDKERRRSGKPFPFQQNDPDCLSLFFDDNVTEDPNSDEGIIATQSVDGAEVSVPSVLGTHIFMAELISAILEDTYFIDRVNQALELGAYELRIENAKNCCQAS